MNNQLPNWITARLVNPVASAMACEQIDDQLWQMLDEPSTWLVRGGSIGVLGTPSATLRAALHQAYEFSMQDQSPGPIVRMPNDSIVVPADQIYRLWRALGFSVR